MENHFKLKIIVLPGILFYFLNLFFLTVDISYSIFYHQVFCGQVVEQFSCCPYEPVYPEVTAKRFEKKID